MSDLPASWARCEFGEVAQIVGGSTPPSKGAANFDRAAGTAWITPADLSGYKAMYISRGARNLTAQGLAACSARLLPAGAVLFSSRAPIGYVAIASNPVTTNQGFKSFVLPAEIDARFVYFYLRHIKPIAEARATGTTFKELSGAATARLPLLLAPLPEQKRIADKLEALLARVDACRERLDLVPAILKRFRQAVLAAATSGELTREWRGERGDAGELQAFQFEDAEVIRDYSFPASWSTRRLSEIATIAGGVTKDSKKQLADFTELPYLRVANVQRGYLDLSEVKTIRVPPDRVGELLLRAGDILFNEGGDIDKLGRGWVWNDELPACVFQNHIFRARLLDSSFEPRYFSWYGNSRGCEYFLARGKQTTNLASINKSVLSALPIAVPPAEEQAEIVRRVHELFQLAEYMERCFASAKARVGALTSSVLAKAFRGELAPQDPNDEPASELLARLKVQRSAAAAEPPRRRPKAPRKRQTMTNTAKASIKAAILKLKSDSFAFDDLKAQVAGDYESLKDALFELLEEPTPVVRQVFNKKTRTMQLERVRP